MPDDETRMYLIYDGRARFGDTDDAVVYFAVGYSWEEAARSLVEDFPDGCIYSYREDGDVLVDEREEPWWELKGWTP